MALNTPKRLSVAEFLALPEQGSPAFRQELLCGEVRTRGVGVRQRGCSCGVE